MCEQCAPIQETEADIIVLEPNVCPVSHTKGKAVKLVTLKALLRPEALATLEPKLEHFFCPDPTCEVVYFNAAQRFTTADVKVRVFQKDAALEVPVCYCFGYTRERLAAELKATGSSQASATIDVYIKAGRCGCELNNPQGACCLGNVNREVATLNQGLCAQGLR